MSEYSYEQYREEYPGDTMSGSSRQRNPAYYPANQPRLPLSKPRRTSEGPDRPEDSPRSIVDNVVVNTDALIVNQRTSRSARIAAHNQQKQVSQMTLEEKQSHLQRLAKERADYDRQYLEKQQQQRSVTRNGPLSASGRPIARQTSKSRYGSDTPDYLDSPSFYGDCDGLEATEEVRKSNNGPTGLAGSSAVVREPSMIVMNNNRRRSTNNAPTRKVPSTRRLASVGVLQRSNTHSGVTAPRIGNRNPMGDSSAPCLAGMRNRMNDGSNRSLSSRKVENLRLSNSNIVLEPPALVNSTSTGISNSSRDLRRQTSNRNATSPPPTRRNVSGGAPRRAAALSRQYSTGSQSARSNGSIRSQERLQRRPNELPANRLRVSEPQSSNQYSRPQQEERYQEPTQRYQEQAPPTPSQASQHSASCASTHSSATLVEIQPGLEAPLRATEETLEAINMNYVTSQACLACNTELYCIADAQYYICPICRVISPIFATEHSGELPEGSRHGVGLGFTRDTLMEQRSHHRQEQWRSVEAL